jgi:hypothetical protein
MALSKAFIWEYTVYCVATRGEQVGTILFRQKKIGEKKCIHQNRNLGNY